MKTATLLLAAVLAFALFAGCLGGDDPEPPPPAPTGWILDCTLGSIESGPWLQDCLARASHTPGPKQEIWLAVNPTDPDNVVLAAKDNNPSSSADCTWNGVFVTHDGGATWADIVIGGRYVDRRPGDPWYGYACNTDPMFVFNTDGTLHYVLELYNLGGASGYGPLGPGPQSGRGMVLPGWKILLVTSHDGGLTWPAVATQWQSDGEATILDYSRVTVNPLSGSVLTAINGFSGFDGLPYEVNAPELPAAGEGYSYCNVLVSRDKGRTVEPPVVVRNTEGLPSLFCGIIQGAPDGTILLGFMEFGDDGTITTWWSRSTDDGAAFSEPEASFSYPGQFLAKFEENAFRVGSNFEAAYDPTQGPRRGTLYLVYSIDGAGSDILVRSSQDHGATWSEPVRVNDDEGDHDQWMPNIVVAGDGSVHVFYMDKRWDPANRLIDITHALSTDGGRTWTNTRVTNQSWDGDLGEHQEKFPFIGDYLGIGAAGDVVWGGFPDASNGATTVVAAARIQLHA